jgi:vacuolar protein sorting-associated protein 54
MRFVMEVEEITAEKMFTLRRTMLTTLKSFLDHFHSTKKGSLAATLDKEVWKQVDVSAERQQTLDSLANGAVLSVDDVNGSSAGGGTGAAAGAADGSGGADAEKHAVVDGQPFGVVWSCLLLMDIVIQYLACATHFPTLAKDVLSRLVDIFLLFNSRTKELVLGAGAMQGAQLKRITAGHLALCSRCLSLVVVELPYVRAALAIHLSTKQHVALGELDKVMQEFQDHNEKIFAKFIGMVGDVLERGMVDIDVSSVSHVAAVGAGVLGVHGQAAGAGAFPLLERRINYFFSNVLFHRKPDPLAETQLGCQGQQSVARHHQASGDSPQSPRQIAAPGTAAGGLLPNI